MAAAADLPVSWPCHAPTYWHSTYSMPIRFAHTVFYTGTLLAFDAVQSITLVVEGCPCISGRQICRRKPCVFPGNSDDCLCITQCLNEGIIQSRCCDLDGLNLPRDVFEVGEFDIRMQVLLNTVVLQRQPRGDDGVQVGQGASISASCTRKSVHEIIGWRMRLWLNSKKQRPLLFFLYHLGSVCPSILVGRCQNKALELVL